MSAWSIWLLEASIPLVGPILIYGVVGFLSGVPKDDPKTYWGNYKWKEFFDALGWLYGAAYIAIQTALSDRTKSFSMTFFIWSDAIVCSLLLALATKEKGEASGKWAPPLHLSVIAVFLTLAILFCGCIVYE